MKRIWPILLLAMTFAPAFAEMAEIRVLTFNIRYGTARDEGHTWDLRREAVAKTIHNTDPDFVGLQEALDFQIDYLQEHLDPRWVFVGEGRDGGRAGEHASILYDCERFSLLRAGRFWLSETPDVPASKSWSRLTRMVTWIEVSEKSTSNRFFVLNTHFSHVSDVARANSARLILKRLDEISPSPESVLILMGDFNCHPDSEPHTVFVGEDGAFRDTRIEAGVEEQSTFNGFRERETEDGRPIDWILVRGPVTVESHLVVTQRVEGVTPSDHFPVLASLQYEVSE